MKVNFYSIVLLLHVYLVCTLLPSSCAVQVNNEKGDDQLDEFDVQEEEEEEEGSEDFEIVDQDDEVIVEDGESFLDAYGRKPGVLVLPSGVQYKVIKSSTKPNAKHPAETSLCKVNYDGKLTNGESFDSTFEREEPALLRLNQVRLFIFPSQIIIIKRSSPDGRKCYC